MFEKIWQSLMRWVRKLFGRGGKALATSRSSSERRAELPPLDDTDREYLFMQLLEGVAHGWQQPRAVNFFNKIRQRVRKSEWLEWLDRFGENLLAAPVPNYELADRMVQLSQLDCGEICDLAGEYGNRLLERLAAESPAGLIPIVEFGQSDADEPFGRSYGGEIASDEIDEFADIPPELLEDRSSEPELAPEEHTHTREITLEEFADMLHKDPNLVAELAQQFGIETTDPQVIVNAVIAQMQQQVQPISGELNPPAPVPTAAEPQTTSPPPPPPPAPEKLELKSDDPWSDNLAKKDRELSPETVKSPDRGA